MFTRSRVAITLAFLFVPIAAQAPAAEEAAQQAAVKGRVVQVTLYRGQALVTREVAVAGDKGSLTIVVGDLPEQVLQGSLFAEGNEQIEIRAVRYRTRAVGQEPREEVRKLDEALEAANQKLALNQQNAQLLAKKSAYLDKLEGFVAPTAKLEVSKGVLNAESLEKITKFSFEQRQEIAAASVKLQAEAKELQAAIELLKRKRAEIAGKAMRMAREAVLFLQKHNDAQQTIRLNYLVEGCGWSPTYTFRSGKEQPQVQIEYNALIHQLTGEDWSDVRLTLSTASPALSSSGPGLAPFHVALSSGPKQQVANTRTEVLSQAQALRGRQYEAIVSNRNTSNFRDNTGTSWTLNGLACQFQVLELTSGKDAVAALQLGTPESTEGPSLSYKLQAPVSLASRRDQQMVRIMQTELPGKLYHVATPVLTSYVYRETEINNSSNHDLLGGPVSVYLDGRFVGRCEIPTVARGQTFVVGFGADAQLRTRRELVAKTEGVQGGNRELNFKYRLVIENYKKTPATVRLFDRLPHAHRSSDVRITLASTGTELSEDKLYQRTERPKNILRWDVEVPAGSVGEQAKLVMYEFSVEFERAFSLTAATGSQQLQQEFEQLQKARVKR